MCLAILHVYRHKSVLYQTECDERNELPPQSVGGFQMLMPRVGPSAACPASPDSVSKLLQRFTSPSCTDKTHDRASGEHVFLINTQAHSNSRGQGDTPLLLITAHDVNETSKSGRSCRPQNMAVRPALVLQLLRAFNNPKVKILA